MEDTMEKTNTYLFGVKECEVTVAGTDRVIPNKKCIVREDNGSPISIVGKNYKVIPNGEIVEAFEAALDTLPDFKKRKVTTALPFGGAQMFRKYTFDSISLAPKVGDIIKLQLELSNSYDGKLKGGFAISGLRLACTNGQMIPGKIHEITSKHSNSFNLDRIVESIKVALPAFDNVVKTWKTWDKIKVNATEIIDMLNKASLPEKTVLKIAEQFKKEHHTKWGAFQAATYVISHEVESRNAENTRSRQIALESQLTPVFYN
jgi:hypothetical protein